MQLQEGMLFDDRYRLIKLLGRGGFSEVWLVEDAKAGNIRMALKVYAPGQGLDDDGVQLFSGEFSLVFNLNHAHILHPSHFDVCDRSPYLIMPFCDRGSAAKLAGKITEEEAWRFLHGVAAGLAYLHGQEPPIIHQDIKPDNVLIDNRGNYLITDFGISAQARSTLRRSAGEAKTPMTVAYTPSERFTKNHAPIRASDIWSLGATLFELLEGDVPFIDILGGQAQRNGAEIPEITGNRSPELKKIVTLCLQLETWDRPTAQQLVEWTEKHFRGEKITFEPKPLPPDPKPAPRPWYKKRAVLAIIACIAVVVSVAFYMTQKRSGDKSSEHTEAVLSPEETDWKKAVEGNTLQAYRQYVSQYPAGKHVDEAKQKITAFEDEQAWTAATEKNTLEGYRAYLAAQPHGRYAATAGNLITGLESQQAQQEEINRQRQAGGSTATTAQSATTQQSPPTRQPSQQAETADGRQTGSTAFVEPEMVLVRGGTFTMGCTPEQGSDCSNDEKPAHQVTVSDFQIGKYEVTQALWQAVMGSNPSSFKGDNLPVERVSWNNVQEFISRLNARTGKQYRLPTEAEWEFAARGGNNSRGYKYSGSNNPSDVGWFRDNSGDKTHPVGTKFPNELGLYDMSGNVFEWCSDWYSDYGSNAQTDPQGLSSGSLRVLRGGSWSNSAGYARVSFRDYWFPDDWYNNLGFRLVRSSK